MQVNQIKDMAPTPTHSLPITARLTDALDCMERNGIHHLVVTNPQDGLISVVEDRQILKHIAKELTTDGHLSDLKLQAPKIVSPEMEIGLAFEALLQAPQKILLVQRGPKADAGVVTETDFLTFLHNLLSKDQEEHPLLKTELHLAHPLFQSIMRTLSDVGI